jgi:flagellar protein FliL
MFTAQEEDSRLDNSQERDAPPAGASEDAAPAKKKFAIAKVAVIAGVILAQIVGSYFLQKVLFFGNAPLAAQATVRHDPEQAKTAEAGAETDSQVLMLDEIVINPAETGGRRYLSITVGLQMPAGEEAKAAMDKSSPLIRDALITLLSSKHLDELADPQRRDSLKLEIKEAVNSRLKDAPVRGVVFSGYVLQ